jgi:hypothetical protein
MHQHPITHPGLGEAGQAHLLANAPEIHLGTTPQAGFWIFDLGPVGVGSAVVIVRITPGVARHMEQGRQTFRL